MIRIKVILYNESFPLLPSYFYLQVLSSILSFLVFLFSPFPSLLSFSLISLLSFTFPFSSLACFPSSLNFLNLAFPSLNFLSLVACFPLPPSFLRQSVSQSVTLSSLSFHFNSLTLLPSFLSIFSHAPRLHFLSHYLHSLLILSQFRSCVSSLPPPYLLSLPPTFSYFSFITCSLFVWVFISLL